MRDAVDHWVDLIHDDIVLDDVERVRSEFYSMVDDNLLNFFCIDFTGIFAYEITKDYKGKDIMSALVFYIKPCYRGSIKLLKKYIYRAEREAKKIGCASLYIGGNIGRKNIKIFSFLKRMGYSDRSVIKYLEV